MLNTDYLAEKIAPYTYQIKKSDCFQLPDKHYSTKYCQLTGWQNHDYDTVLDNLLTGLDEMSNTAIYQLFGALQAVISGYVVAIKYDRSMPHAIRKKYIGS